MINSRIATSCFAIFIVQVMLVFNVWSANPNVNPPKPCGEGEAPKVRNARPVNFRRVPAGRLWGAMA